MSFKEEEGFYILSSHNGLIKMMTNQTFTSSCRCMQVRDLSHVVMLQSYRNLSRKCEIQCYAHEYDIISGVLRQARIATQDANIDYLQSHISFWHQSKQHVLVFGSATSDSACLSALELKKMASEADSQIYVMIVSDPDSHASADTANFMAQPILRDYADVFSETPPGIPPERGIGHMHTINTSINSPIARPAYRMSPKEKDCAEEMVSQLIQKGWIRPSHSPYSSPILFVQKKDGSLRMCVDYRALNE